MEKLDLTKKYKSYYTAKGAPGLVEIEAAQYLSLEGQGDPSAPAFVERIEALYSTAYAVKFAFKDQGKDFTVAKLEGQWWYDEATYGGLTIEEAPKQIPRSEWQYRLLIRLPDYVQEQDVQAAIDGVLLKKGIGLAAAIRFFRLQEGKCVQMLHVGPFDKEPESLLVMKEYMDKKGLRQNGLHHEIYLSDFRKTAPEG
ncbi:GyrI-like domain-containing protein [Paraflavitalea speifideaquila]|uniref:GyrI-like domain-containing protein n=1 Tax=Paraflavitalea speifideaquila TaxID=3076558 RepID=UPI0028E9997C|nr:GyrI-like domain-containing protein [Paraflavitalea speifideiaquila]